MAQLSSRTKPAQWSNCDRLYVGWPGDLGHWGEVVEDIQEEVASLVEAVLFPDPNDETGARSLGEEVVLCCSGEDARITAEAFRLGCARPDRVALIDLDVVAPPPGGVGMSFVWQKHGELAASLFGSDSDADKAALTIAAHANTIVRQFGDVPLSAGFVDVDGEGRAIIDRAAFAREAQKTGMSVASLEGVMRAGLGVDKAIWIDSSGFEGWRATSRTRTNSGRLARFVAPGVVAIMEPNGEDDPFTDLYLAVRRQVESEGSKAGLEVIAIPSPGLVASESGILGASHLDFQFSTQAFILPSFGNLSGEDDSAFECLERLESHIDRKHLYAIDASALLLGGASFEALCLCRPSLTSQF